MNNKGSLPLKSSHPSEEASEAAARDAADGKSREGSSFRLLNADSEDWLVLRRRVRAGFPFYEYHFGSHRQNESEPHVALFLPNWPIFDL